MPLTFGASEKFVLRKTSWPKGNALMKGAGFQKEELTDFLCVSVSVVNIF